MNLSKISIALLILINGFYLQAIGQEEIEYSVFLTGNTAEGLSPEQGKFIDELTATTQPKAFVYLGNFSDRFTEDDKTIYRFYPEIKDKNTPLLFANGNMEWQNGKKQTKKVAKALQKQFPNNEVYTTDWGCPGPTEVQLSDNLTVILIDTYWWLTALDTRYGKCGIEEDEDVFIWLQDALRVNKDKTVILAGFHPLESYGPHGGQFPTSVNIFGFPYAFYKNTLGSKNDLVHPNYRNLRQQLHAVLHRFPNVIYASALENSLQYIETDNIHQVISGSLVNQNFANSKKADFASSSAGISRIDVYENGNVVLNFFTLENGTQEPVFSRVLFSNTTKTDEDLTASRDALFREPTHTTYASLQYQADKKYKKWMGENYREVWETPVEARVFDISKEKGGLSVLKRGGGQQTKSVRMENEDGHQYVLRSLEKYAEGALPNEMKPTFAKDIVQDQISASNPYSALPAAVLAEHAGVFHTNPEIVYVPQDPLFQQYKEDMHSGLFLFEERPAKDRRDVASFGNSEDIVSTDEVLDKITESEDHQVDQNAVLRARLLDIFINDWDRHDDQWRWASFEDDKKTIYRPIPRDRDQTFFVNQGILPGIASMPFILPKLQNFQPRTKNVVGLGFNARYFDRTFLNQMEWEDWQTTNTELMDKMTPEAIYEAMTTFPKEVQPMVANSTAKILLERKQYMEEMAHELYLYLARRINIPGTDRRDLFEINRKNDDETEISVYHIKKDDTKGKLIYQRTIKTDETREVVCYGLDEEDRFEINGEVKKGPVIRIVGGQDKDEVVNNSKVTGLKNKTLVYDLRKSTEIEGSGKTSSKLTDNKIIHEYDRKYFQRDVGMPLASGGYNADDGVYLGYGRSWYKQKFRRDEKTSLLGEYTFRNSSLNIKAQYESLSTNNGLDAIFGIDASTENYTTNFYGFGNNSTYTNSGFDYKYFKVRQRRIVTQLAVQKRFGESVWARYEEEDEHKDHPINEHKIGLLAQWKLTDTKDEENKFITDFANNGLTPDNLGQIHYAVLGAYYEYQNLDKDFRPTRGFVANASANHYVNVQGKEPDFTKFQGSAATLLSFNKYPRTVFAFRVGGEKIFGDYYFHDAAILDGKTNLRGYRKTRFYGDASAYLNSELRFKLIDFKNYLLTGELGIVAFDDIGRVWFDGEDSSKWHNGYGAGIWVSPFKMAIVTATLNKSREETLVQFNFSFLF
ncbi:BamA/TamA family outer membrane protein [Draconibacterium sp. IB214405]|uniref:BamA/TamA family outer membrane protein n=1 Tax=Draconibacterium sp. IB214405 TaxID=3097352 RepID=UPI002A137185|nr:BamA/TamA family outer membrane protein [Draconibacterium sp. IB214405]MDX8341496.1 BamA/TamA family outer membrane protein [Draconibacterium sp. IB214405]